MKSHFFTFAVSCALGFTFLHAQGKASSANIANAADKKVEESPYDTVRTFFEDGSVSRVYTVLRGTETREGLSVTYHPNGKVAIEAPYKNGVLDGVLRSYFENGKVWKTIGYKNGDEEGFSIVFHENGVRARKESYKAGILDGMSEEWNEKGVVVRKIPYVKGQIHGKAQIYDELGALKEEMTFNHGIRHGSYRRYEKGVKVLEAVFENNRCVKDCNF